jgi:hypothetical protein
MATASLMRRKPRRNQPSSASKGGTPPGAAQPSVTMRICGADDERALRRLAGRDTARPLEGTILVAEIDDQPLAALCLETGRVVADPFSRTAELVDLLRARAAQLQSAQRVYLPEGRQGLRRAWAWLWGLP